MYCGCSFSSPLFGRSWSHIICDLVQFTSHDRARSRDVTEVAYKVLLQTFSSLIRQQIDASGRLLNYGNASEALKQVDTTEIVRLLAEIASEAPSFVPKNALEAKFVGELREHCRKIAQFWNVILEVDPSREEAEFKRLVQIRGPKAKIETIRSAVTAAIDDAIISAVVDSPLGIHPTVGRLLVLDPESPALIDGISVTGDALKKRVEELGGTLAPEAEVVEFLAMFSAENYGEEPDDESDEDDDPIAQGGWAAN